MYQLTISFSGKKIHKNIETSVIFETFSTSTLYLDTFDRALRLINALSKVLNCEVFFPGVLQLRKLQTMTRLDVGCFKLDAVLAIVNFGSNTQVFQ